MARDMYGPMTGASAWMMTPTWDALASAAALGDVGGDDDRHDAAVRLAAVCCCTGPPRDEPRGGTAGHQIYALAAGYLVVWMAVQSRGNRAAACSCVALDRLADDGGDEFPD